MRSSLKRESDGSNSVSEPPETVTSVMVSSMIELDDEELERGGG